MNIERKIHKPFCLILCCILLFGIVLYIYKVDDYVALKNSEKRAYTRSGLYEMSLVETVDSISWRLFANGNSALFEDVSHVIIDGLESAPDGQTGYVQLKRTLGTELIILYINDGDYSNALRLLDEDFDRYFKSYTLRDVIAYIDFYEKSMENGDFIVPDIILIKDLSSNWHYFLTDVLKTNAVPQTSHSQ